MILALKQTTIDAGQSELMEGKYQFLSDIRSASYDPKWPHGYFRRDVTLCEK